MGVGKMSRRRQRREDAAKRSVRRSARQNSILRVLGAI
jgi:hypothetical protein